MAYATATYIAIALAAAAAGTSYYNTKTTEKKQDNALADQILNQSKRQKEADGKVNEQVTALQGSTSSDERAKSMDDYMKALTRNRGKIQSGLTDEGIGGQAFNTNVAAANDATMTGATANANLMSRMDAPTMQRQGEAFGFGKLATDLSLIGRQAQGDNYLDELRLRGIRRNAELDLASGLMGSASGSVAGYSGGGGASATANGVYGAGQGTGNTAKNILALYGKQ